MDTLSRFKVLQKAIKGYVVLCGIFLTIYTGLLCLDIRNDLVEIFAITMTYIILGYSLWVYRLCLLSWAFLVYSYIIRCCIVFRRMGLFGDYLDFAHLTAFAIGSFLVIFFFSHITKYNDQC